LFKFFERYKRLNDYQPSAAEELANVDRFKKFGAKMTIKSLSEKYHKTMGEVLQMQAEEIYEVLLMDFEQSQYQKDLEQAYKMLAKKK
jgi:predicted O-methyltransferase YrrM